MKDKKKAGTITRDIEIPVQVTYRYYPAEPMTYHDPGHPAWVEYETAMPSREDIAQAIEFDADGIEQACLDDAEDQ